ncbi:MAG: MFS transporter [Chloracidobacterium sp.]|nr:MFS transporter [Chloracidobacterium sp.]
MQSEKLKNETLVMMDNYGSGKGEMAPGFIHAFLLMAGSCMPIMGGLLIAPVLPEIQRRFSGVPRVEILAPIALTIPALFIAILAPFAGAIIDRLGRLRPLVIALALYAAFGTAPLWLESLYSIIVSRAGVGLAEAVIMTCCTTLIGDYYDGKNRSKLLALQTTYVALSASLFFLAGGLLGELGWRAPFWVYGVSLLIAPLAQIYLWEPERKRRPEGEDEQTPGGAAAPPFRALLLLGICGINLLTTIAFFVVPVHLGYLLNDVGVRSTRTIGIILGLAAITKMIGSLIFHRLNIIGFATSRLLALGCALAGSGLLILAAATTMNVISIGALINGFGGGMLIPTILTWNMGALPPERRGLGTGVWTASTFLGQFVNPIVVLALAGIAGGRAAAIHLIGLGLLVLMILSLAAATLKPAKKSEDSGLIEHG